MWCLSTYQEEVVEQVRGRVYGRDIRSGKAVENAREVFQRAYQLGLQLSKVVDYLVVGESIPGGTTTALALLLATGVDARGKVSGSMPNNPHNIKIKVVEEALSSAGIIFGSLKDDPFGAITAVGDPMMPAAAGLICGAAENVPVLMAGGTQMGAVLNIVKSHSPRSLDHVAIGTTRWILEDRNSSIRGIVANIAPVPILAADLDFSQSRFDGLRAYELGWAKEGVGAGGSSIAAMVKSEGAIDKNKLMREIEGNYERIVGVKPQ